MTAADFQITDFGDYQNAYRVEQIMGYFLISDKVYDEFLGKYLQASGIIPEEWQNKNTESWYHRLVLKNVKIERVDNSTCNPYPQITPTADNAQDRLKLKGTLIRSNRSSPDGSLRLHIIVYSWLSLTSFPVRIFVYAILLECVRLLHGIKKERKRVRPLRGGQMQAIKLTTLKFNSNFIVNLDFILSWFQSGSY